MESIVVFEAWLVFGVFVEWGLGTLIEWGLGLVTECVQDLWGFWKTNDEEVRNLALTIGLPLLIWRLWLASRQTDISNKQAETAANQADTANKLLSSSQDQSKTAQAQLVLAKHAQNIDRFQSACSMLAGDSEILRHAGLLIISRLVEQELEYLTTTEFVLETFVRMCSKELEKERLSPVEHRDQLRTSALIVMAVHIRITLALRRSKSQRQSIDLEGAWLVGAKLVDLPGRIHLSGAFLMGADLRGARLADSYFLDAYVHRAKVYARDVHYFRFAIGQDELEVFEDPEDEGGVGA
ncbi:MAG: hypothetical protein AAF184_09760 [Pseudomonadota bacterium]